MGKEKSSSKRKRQEENRRKRLTYSYPSSDEEIAESTTQLEKVGGTRSQISSNFSQGASVHVDQRHGGDPGAIERVFPPALDMDTLIMLRCDTNARTAHKTGRQVGAKYVIHPTIGPAFGPDSEEEKTSLLAPGGWSVREIKEGSSRRNSSASESDGVSNPSPDIFDMSIDSDDGAGRITFKNSEINYESSTEQRPSKSRNRHKMSSKNNKLRIRTKRNNL